MNNEKIEIKKSNVLASYEEARKSGANGYMQFLENLFGKELFKPKDVMERVKTFDDAIKELGEEHPYVKAYREWVRVRLANQKDIEAYLKLRIICAALNEGWKPKFTEGEWRYYPWVWLYTQDEINNMDEQDKQDQHLISTGDYETGYAGLAYAHSANAPSYSSAYVGSRLCLKNEALAVYCGKQFIDIWADFLLPRK